VTLICLTFTTEHDSLAIVQHTATRCVLNPRTECIKTRSCKRLKHVHVILVIHYNIYWLDGELMFMDIYIIHKLVIALCIDSCTKLLTENAEFSSELSICKVSAQPE
jgi:hypothetical protein